MRPLFGWLPLVAACVLATVGCSGDSPGDGTADDTGLADTWEKAAPKPIRPFQTEAAKLIKNAVGFVPYSISARPGWSLRIRMDMHELSSRPLFFIPSDWDSGASSDDVTKSRVITSEDGTFAFLVFDIDSTATYPGPYRIIATTEDNWVQRRPVDTRDFELRVDATIACDGPGSSLCPDDLKCLYTPFDASRPGKAQGYCAPFDACTVDDDCVKCTTQSECSARDVAVSQCGGQKRACAAPSGSNPIAVAGVALGTCVCP